MKQYQKKAICNGQIADGAKIDWKSKIGKDYFSSSENFSNDLSANMVCAVDKNFNAIFTNGGFQVFCAVNPAFCREVFPFVNANVTIF
jgi:hypothetical protein